MSEKNISFGAWSIIGLIINAIGARIFLNFPRTAIETAGNAGWLLIIYVVILILIIFTIINKLYSTFPGKDIIDLADYTGGTPMRILIGIPIIAILVFIGSIILREYAENIKIIALPVSPISFVMLFFIAGMVVGAYAGIEAIARLHLIIVPIIAAAYLFIIAGVSKYFDFSFFYPILGTGLDKILGNGFFKISLFAPILYLFLFNSFIKTHKNFKKAGYISLIVCSILFLISTASYIAVFPFHPGLEVFLPTFELARLIYWGRFFQRIESVFMLTWATSSLMYLSLILYSTCYTFKKVFKLKYHRPLILPFTIIIFSISILPPNLMSAITLETEYYSQISWVVTLAMPLLLLIIANIKHKKRSGGKSK